MSKKNTNLQKAMAAGSSMTGSLIVCGGLGYFLYQKYEHNIYYLAGGLILGAIVGMYEIYKQIKWNIYASI